MPGHIHMALASLHRRGHSTESKGPVFLTSSHYCSTDRDDDVAEVVESVQRLTSTWPKLGLYLHLREDSIKTIEKNNPRDAQQCLHDAIVEWLKQNYNFHKFGSPSWRVLVYAVKKLDAALAYEIAGNHISMHDRLNS